MHTHVCPSPVCGFPNEPSAVNCAICGWPMDEDWEDPADPLLLSVPDVESDEE